MSTSLNQIASDLQKIITESDDKKTKPYDTIARVTRPDGDILYVQFPGSDDETPVQSTITAKPGEIVRVRVSGGRAWTLGNADSPPTDDTTANQAKDVAYTADENAHTALINADDAKRAAESAIKDADIAREAASSAQQSANAASTAAATAQANAIEAKSAATAALTNLATVESVVDTLQWLTDHSTLTTDTVPVEGKTYYVKNPDGLLQK